MPYSFHIEIFQMEKLEGGGALEYVVPRLVYEGVNKKVCVCVCVVVVVVEMESLEIKKESNTEYRRSLLLERGVVEASSWFL